MMATVASSEEFVRGHEILVEATIGRSRERAEDLIEAHIASTLAVVFPNGAGRAS
jgi:DNA-binding GntR family transcriptional regulator